VSFKAPWKNFLTKKVTIQERGREKSLRTEERGAKKHDFF
jgi:hypothetical protein